MTIVVNGQERDAGPRPTLADAAALVGVSPSDSGVAAAVDGVVVPRSAWGTTRLEEGARVEVVRAAAGG